MATSSIPCVICGTLAWDENDRYAASQVTTQEIRANNAWCWALRIRQAIEAGDVVFWTLGRPRETQESLKDAPPAEVEAYALATIQAERSDEDHVCDDPANCRYKHLQRFCAECWIDVLEGPCRIRIRGERGFLWQNT